MKEHPKYKRYYVSEDGKIFSAKSGSLVELSQFSNGIGYMKVKLYHNGNRPKPYVHRLVAETYIPNPSDKSSVNHKDGDKQNNTLSNLEWVSHQENMDHARETGLWDPRKK